MRGAIQVSPISSFMPTACRAEDLRYRRCAYFFDSAGAGDKMREERYVRYERRIGRAALVIIADAARKMRRLDLHGL